MQSWFCCTQQRVVEMICLHCAGEQQAVVPVAPAVQVSPARVQSLHTPPEQELPAQQSVSAEQLWPRMRHTQRPPEHSIAPQQSALVWHIALTAAQAQVPPVHAAPLQQSEDDPHAPPERLQQVPVVPLVVALHEIDAPPEVGQQRVPVVPDEHDAPGLAHMPEPTIWQVPLRHSRPMAHCALVVQAPPAALRAQWPDWHVSSPQHWLSAVQAPDSARQQRVSPCDDEQVVPDTQGGMVIIGSQRPPAGVGVLVPLEHVPLLHVRPVQQGDIALQAVPAPLQRVHVPPRHWNAGLLHCVPDVQQG